MSAEDSFLKTVFSAYGKVSAYVANFGNKLSSPPSIRWYKVGT
jgi:hypothetical protein